MGLASRRSPREDAEGILGAYRMEKITVPDILGRKGSGKRISSLTAYDCPTARIVDAAGIDIILVGDSLGDNVLGYSSTLPVTMDEMIHHTKAVARGVQRALLCVDMPFLSFQLSTDEAVFNAGRFIKEAGAEAVKIEGGQEIAPAVARMTEIGIPVMGHLGMTPQKRHTFGRFGVQGKTKESAEKMVDDAEALQEAGVFSVVLELVKADLAAKITESLRVPTIGIGSGPDCDGQILVLHDLVGLNKDVPRHVRKYADLFEVALDAVRRYKEDIESGRFP
jgi:3-methyl-2-oxobutanoate hydroxymethyltransferase